MLPGLNQPGEDLDPLHRAVHLAPGGAGQGLLGEQGPVGTEERVSDHPGYSSRDTDVVHLALGRHVSVQTSIDETGATKTTRNISVLKQIFSQNKNQDPNFT